MYAVTPVAADAWRAVFALVCARSGAPLRVVEHPAPAPLEALWSRDDLGLAFMCGYPFALGRFAVEPIAVPLPVSSGRDGQATYSTHFIVRADGPFRCLADTFGGTIGWTVEHSQSGFNAVRHHLMRLRAPGQGSLYGRSVGPLVTPRRVIDAVLNRDIDVGPLDSYVYDLLAKHEPRLTDRLRIVARTEPTPMPLLVASANVAGSVMERLRASLLDLSALPEAAPHLANLCIGGFAAAERGPYASLLSQAEAAERAGYATLGSRAGETVGPQERPLF
jgi:ABC-type phosphate/phosphonate transport system substrate-binding protein